MSRIARVVSGAALLAIFVAAGSALAMREGGGRPPPITAIAVKDGMRLVLQLKGDAYPRNALVPAMLRLTNLSGRTAYLYDCQDDSLGALVTRGRGVDLYPDLLPPPGAPWPICPGQSAMGAMPHHGTAIPTGTTVTRMTYVVLRAFTVRGWADFDFSRMPGPPIALLTPEIHLRSITVTGPSVHIESARPSTAVVTPVPGAGPTEYSQYVSCMRWPPHYSIAVGASATFSRWMRAPGATISAPCAHPNEWMLFVAQPGLPAAHAYYCRQHDRCAHAPPSAHDRALAACKIGLGKAIASGKLPRSAARYAIGLSSTLPAGLTAAQRALAEKFHDRCAPLLKLKP